MNYILIAFKSRTNLLNFYNNLNKYSVSARLVNTTRSVSVSCGMSVKTDKRNLDLCVKLINKLNLGGFLGIYLVTNEQFNQQAKRIY